MQTISAYTPSKQTMKEVRVCLLIRGQSFAGYCREAGYTRQNLAAAFTGKLKGPKAEKAVQAVLSDLGLTQ